MEPIRPKAKSIYYFFKGKFKLLNTNSSKNRYDGDIKFEDIRLLNKPPETEADTKIKQSLEKSRFFKVVTEADQKYDYLSLFSNTEELLYVRKK